MMANLKIPVLAVSVIFGIGMSAEVFETADQAVVNMRLGWNLGNTLDSNSGDVNNMWLEAWSDRTPSAYETAWGQPVTTRELIRMFKDAGFNAIRVPVTWYPHIGSVEVKVGPNAQGDWVGTWDMSSWSGYDIDPVWMARVKEVVDYVIDEGMYCLLNVHHDTGDGSIAWLRADMDVYDRQRERFESLWTQIAEQFKDYDEHLLFEGYNEMLDSYGSWCFASFATQAHYNAEVARSAYDAINSYARSFVNAVRATGGNNAVRNLVVNTYGACSGSGSWNSHLKDPLVEMTVPDDPVDGHIIIEIHAYPEVKSVRDAKLETDELITLWKKHLMSKGVPVIVGEWGTSTSPSFSSYQQNLEEFARYFVEKTKAAGIATFYWMTLSDGTDRSVPAWTNPGLKDAMVKGYYGDEGYEGISYVINDPDCKDTQFYNMQGIEVVNPTKGIYIHNGKKVIIR